MAHAIKRNRKAARPRNKRRNPAAAVDPASQLRPLLEERAEAVRRGRYELLGTIAALITEDGAMRFPGQGGPAVAFLEGLTRTVLVITTAWEGLPDIRTVTSEPCQGCLHDCDVCDENGRKMCEGQGCRNASLKAGFVPCEMCGGARSIKCPQCEGTKKYPTGILNGGTNYKDGKCPECNGLRFQGSDAPQDESKFTSKDSALGPDFTVLGPIVAVVIDNIPGSAKAQTIFDVERDPDGDYLVLVLEKTPAATRAYLVGGVLKEKGRGGR